MKRITKIILAMLVITSLLFNPVFAATVETQEQTDAGVTPESIFYTFDLFFEDLKLAMSSSQESDAILLLEFAQERLVEAKEMTLEENNDFVQEAMQDYLEKHQRAGELITEIIIEESVDEDTLDNLENKLDEATEINDEVEGYLESEDKDLKEKIDNAYLVANVIKDLDKEQVLALRENGMGYGQISQVFALAQYTGKSVEEIAALFTAEDVGFGDVCKLLGVSPSSFNHRKADIKKDIKEPVVEEPVVEEPVVEEPVVEEPVVEEPVVEEPIAEEPIVEEPIAEEPIVKEPIVEKPIAVTPVTDAMSPKTVKDTKINTASKAKSTDKTETGNGLNTVTKSINGTNKDNAPNKDKAQDKANSGNKDNGKNK